jgi:hypothetical protein
MKIEELFNELSEKWICSGNWAPHPFFTNGLIELSILRVWDLEHLAFMASNPEFLDWYLDLEKEKDHGRGGLSNGV